MWKRLCVMLGLLMSAASGAAAATPQVDEVQVTIEVHGAPRVATVTRPSAHGRRPAILLVGGLGCYSLRDLSQEDAPYGGLLRGLTADGFVTMWVEKTGEGGSGGPACSAPEADFQLEIDGYTAALAALKTRDDVDPSRVFLLAHSLGPLDAVRVAAASHVRGVIAAESIGRGWYDYELEIFRQQPLELGHPYDLVERDFRDYERCLHSYFVEKVSSQQLVAATPKCRDILVPGVPDAYMQQVADLDLAKEWKAVDTPVLVIYGDSDPATSLDESRYLVDLINSFHPGRASLKEIPGMGHSLNPEASKAQFLKDHGGAHPRLHPAVLPTIRDWLATQGA